MADETIGVGLTRPSIQIKQEANGVWCYIIYPADKPLVGPEITHPSGRTRGSHIKGEADVFDNEIDAWTWGKSRNARWIKQYS